MKKTNNGEAEKVWNAFKQMRDYLDKSIQIINEVDSDNYYTNNEGKRLYDGVSTLLNTNIGHQNTELIEAIRKQLGVLDNTTLFTCTSDIAIECSKKLCSLTQDFFFSTFFCNSGSEACDTAIKIVLKYWKNRGKNKKIIVSLKGAYHGSSIGAMMLAHEGYVMEDYALKYENFHQISTPDYLYKPLELDENEWINTYINEFIKYCDENEGNIAALFFEPIQLSNAVNVLPKRFVQELCKVCHQREILVVVDEVATGFGRTGEMFASQHYGIWGDIMMLAKGITSGYFPMGAVMVTKDIYYNFYGETIEGKHLEHGYTTGGHPVACSAALKNIELLEYNNLAFNSSFCGEYLLEQLQKNIGQSQLVTAIRGKGLMIAIVFKDVSIKMMEKWGVAEILTNFLVNRGILLYPDDRNVLIIAPYLGIKTEECDLLVNEIKSAIYKIDFILENNI